MSSWLINLSDSMSNETYNLKDSSLCIVIQKWILTWILGLNWRLKLNVKELGIHDSFLRSYSLPDVIYDTKKLTTLRLRFCCLEALLLYHVHISDAQLQRVIERCPSNRTLRLQFCQGISKCHIFGLLHLEYLSAGCCALRSLIFQVYIFDPLDIQNMLN